MSESTPGAEPTPEPTPKPTEPAGSTPSSAQSQANEAVATLKQANPLDLGIIGAGVLAFLGSLLPYYTFSFSLLGASSGTSANAWHGFLGWFGALLALVGAGVVVAKILGVALPVPVPVRTLVLGLFAVAALCTVLALFVVPGGGCDDAGLGATFCDGFDQGHGFGYWLALLATLAGTALAAMRRSAD